MKILFVICLNFLALFQCVLFAQKMPITDTTTSIYKNLPTLKSYAISSSAAISADTSWYKINDKNVDEKTYKKFTQYTGVYNKCRPCILLSFDTSENLLYKRIVYGECKVGYSIEYYLNGKTKVIGKYKENPTGNWENLTERGFCIKDGVWTYFNTKGIATRSEIWKDGKLVKKVTARTK